MKTKQEIIDSLKNQIEEIQDHNTGMDEASWGYETGVILTGHEAEILISSLESELASLQSGEKEEKPLTKEEAMKVYPDLCFCEHSTYTKGICNECGKSQD